MPRKRRELWRVEHRTKSERDLEFLAHARNEPRRQKRVSSKREEVVLATDPTTPLRGPEKVLEDFCKRLLDRRRRRLILARAVVILRARQRKLGPVEFSVGRQRYRRDL